MFLDPSARRGAAALALIGLALTGCGTGARSGGTPRTKTTDFTSQSGMAMLRTAFADTHRSKVMRIRGTVSQGGDRMTLDVRTDARGNCAGTMSQGKGTARLVVTPTAGYIKGDDAFWKDAGGGDPTALLRLLHGRWLKAAPDARIAGLCTLGSGMLSKMMSAMPRGGGVVHVGARSTIDGAEVVELNDGAHGSLGSMFVSIDAPHYIRRVVSDDPSTRGSLTLSGFDDRRPVAVPAADEAYETP